MGTRPEDEAVLDAYDVLRFGVDENVSRNRVGDSNRLSNILAAQLDPREWIIQSDKYAVSIYQSCYGINCLSMHVLFQKDNQCMIKYNGFK